jgi:uncharacterized protein YkwD
MDTRQLLFDVVFLGAAFLLTEPQPEKLVEHPGIQQLHAAAIRVREQAGITTHYVLDEECCKLAQQHANWMAANHSMQHGVHDQIIASGYSTIPAALNGWRNSGGHWSWLAGRSQLCGFGYQRSSSGQWFYCGVFRNRMKQ